MARKKWTYEEIETVIISFIERKAAAGHKDVFPDSISLAHSEALPTQKAIFDATGMCPTAFYAFLFKEGKIPYEYKPRQIPAIITPRNKPGVNDCISMDSERWTSFAKKRGL